MSSPEVKEGKKGFLCCPAKWGCCNAGGAKNKKPHGRKDEDDLLNKKDKPDKPEKPEKPEKHEKPEKPDKPDEAPQQNGAAANGVKQTKDKNDSDGGKNPFVNGDAGSQGNERPTLPILHNQTLNKKSPGLGGTPAKAGFLVSFLVDARGGAMTGHRGCGLRIIIPAGAVEQPVRVTCRYVRSMDRLTLPPPLLEREALASRIVEIGPAGAQFVSPVLLEIPHFASLRDGERELVVLRCDDHGGDAGTWNEHTLTYLQSKWEGGEEEIYEDMVASTQLPPAYEELDTNRVVRVAAKSFPRYLAILSRVRQEVQSIGPDGGKMVAANFPHTQVFFPKGALTKKIKVALQVQKVPGALSQPFNVRASPLVALEPRRRRFHCPVQIMLQMPKQEAKCKSKERKIHLLCSLAGSTSRAHWEDVTEDTPFVVKNDCIIFETRVSALFWALAVPQDESDTDYEPVAVNQDSKLEAEQKKSKSPILQLASHLYNEMVLPPYMAKIVVLFRAHTPHAWCDCLRVLCVTDDRADSYWNEHKFGIASTEWEWKLVAISEEMEISASSQLNFHLDREGNLEIATDCQLEFGYRQNLTFEPFHENAANLLIRVKDKEGVKSGRISVTKSFKYVESAGQVCLCTLNIKLDEEQEKSKPAASAEVPEVNDKLPVKQLEMVVPMTNEAAEEHTMLPMSMVSHVVSWNDQA